MFTILKGLIKIFLKWLLVCALVKIFCMVTGTIFSLPLTIGVYFIIVILKVLLK